MELKRFMEISITTDGFHSKEEPHHLFISLQKFKILFTVNSEAAEQTKKVLRSITSSTTFVT